MQRHQARSLVWKEPSSPGPILGLSLKLAEKPLIAGTEWRRETQVNSARPTDGLFKEHSLGNAWRIMHESSQASLTGHLPTWLSLPVLCTCLSPAGLGICQRGGGRLPFVLFLTFNIHHAVLKMLGPDTGGTQTGDISWRLVTYPGQEWWR